MLCIVVPASQDAPPEKTVELGCASQRRRNCPKAKDSSVRHCIEKMRRELSEPFTLDADFCGPTQDVNLPYGLISRHAPGMSNE
jgi:hypothetical protein